MGGRPLTFMIVAGESSGDAHAARLVSALLKRRPNAKFFGSAGPRMRAAGVEAIVEADSLSVVGLAEIGRALPMFLKAMRRLRIAAEERKPDAAILVDFPDFNLRLARHLKRAGIQIVYYISPQLWAWRKYRISIIREYVDLLITILPFEKDWYAEHGIEHVEYVGNPLVNHISPTKTKGEFCRDHGLDPDRPVISLLPGSRQKEIARILPVMLDAAHAMLNLKSDTQFLIPLAHEGHASFIRSTVAKAGVPALLLTEETYNALKASDAAAVTSGTATLEAGILATPMVVVYKTSAINYRILEPIIDVPHYGLINLIAGERVAAELIQSDLTPQQLSAELTRLLDPETNAKMRRRLATAAAKLGQGGASKRCAELILDLVGD